MIEKHCFRNIVPFAIMFLGEISMSIFEKTKKQTSQECYKHWL